MPACHRAQEAPKYYCTATPSASAAMIRSDGFCAVIFAILLLILIPNQAEAQARGSLSMARQFLAPQNAARVALRLPPLVWDTQVAQYAEWYAKQRRKDCALKHSNGPYGENIFWGSGYGWTPGQAVTDWVSERQWYRYWTNTCAAREECGHYTQIVWSRTKRVGCAKVTCYGGRGEFITCNYDPPGNYIGEKPY